MTSSYPVNEQPVRWTNARDAMPLLAELSGLEIMQGIRDDHLPPPPFAGMMGFNCVVAEKGRIEMTLDHESYNENAAGQLNGGAIATLLDTAMGAAVHTLLPPGALNVTIDLHVNYLRPVLPGAYPVMAKADVLNTNKRTAYVVAELRGPDDALLAHATANFAIRTPA